MKMKNIVSMLAAFAVLSFMTAEAANVIKGDNNNTLDQGTSWNGGNAPGATDVGVWDSTVATAANCTNTLAVSANWGGIEILNPAAPVTIKNSGGAVLSLGSSGIDLDEAGTSQNLSLNLPLFIVSNQPWSVASGRTLFINSTINLTNGAGPTISGHVFFGNSVNVYNGGTLTVQNGAVFESITNGSTTISIGNGASADVVNQTGGAVNLNETGGSSGSPKTTLAIGAVTGATGTYNLTGGTLADTTANGAGVCIVGNASTATGTLDVTNGSAQFVSLRIGNNGGAGTVNVGSGGLITAGIDGGEFSIGRGSGFGSSGTMNVYDGTVSAPGVSVNVPHGIGPGVLNLYSGSSFNVGNSLNVPQSGSAGSGTVNVNGGILYITNNLALPGGTTGGGTVNLNGGVLVCQNVVGAAGGNGILNFDGGTLKARQTSADFIQGSTSVKILSGGAFIDTTNFNLTIAASLQNGNGGMDGGVTKLGAGTLTLSGVNTYTGPTVAGAGTLALSTTNNNTIGALMVSNAATLDAVVATAGSTLNCSSLVEGSGLADSVTNQFDLGDFGNPSAPVINASSLAVNGTVYVVVNGSGFALGTVPLIKYSGSVSGGGTFALKFIAGAVGYVTNDTSAQSINLVITDFPTLTWRASVDTNWDLVTANWVDADNLATPFVPGATVFFDDTANNTTVNLTNVFSPAAVNFNNVNSNYVVSGSGAIAGAGPLIKQGAGGVIMALANNSYAGETIISNGTFQLGVKDAIPSGIGKGDVTLEGKLDLAGFDQAINGFNGDNGIVDNSGATPSVLSVGSASANGVFSGLIENTGASLALNVSGGGLQLLGANNTYSGGTTNSGALVLASPQSIGTGQLTLRGGTLSWADSSPQLLTNQLVITSGVTFGTAANGLLTIQSVADFAGGNRSLTCNEDVIFPNGVTNGFVSSKNGPGVLTIQNTADVTVSGPSWRGGSMILDNCPGIVITGNSRIQSSTPSMARLVLTNGTTMLFTNDTAGSQNFYLGDSDTAGDTNVLDVAGELVLAAYPVKSGNETADALEIGSKNSKAPSLDIVNLQAGGVIKTRQVLKSTQTPGGVVSIFNFNGGILSPNTNDFAGNFVSDYIDQVNVLDGGAIIDTAGWDVTINNDLTAGGNGTGGLVKNGAGQLTLAGSGGFGTSSYGGATIVNAGTLALLVDVPNSTNFITGSGAILDVSGMGGLTISSGRAIGGSGVVVGPITVDSGGLVDPGTATSAGTLTFSNNVPSLNGETLLKLNKGGLPANDQVAITTGTLTYGGALVVTNIGAAPASGDKFYLFSAPSYSGSFSSVTLPALPAGLGWTNNFLGDGSITVTGAVVVVTPPKFNAVVSTGGAVVFSGTNGPASGSYRVLTTTNLALPFANWTPVATNQFDNGNFGYTNTINPTNGTQFFNISVP